MNCLLFFYGVNELFALPLFDLLNQPLQIHIDTSIDGRGARTTRGCSDSCLWRFPHALRRCLGESLMSFSLGQKAPQVACLVLHMCLRARTSADLPII
ncbi:hypothetical protein AMTRI_Chr08g206030 [Amborella trichopoda]